MNDVVAGAGVVAIRAPAAGEHVGARAACQPVLRGHQDILPRASDEAVVLAEPADQVVAAEPEDEIGRGRAVVARVSSAAVPKRAVAQPPLRSQFIGAPKPGGAESPGFPGRRCRREGGLCRAAVPHAVAILIAQARHRDRVAGDLRTCPSPWLPRPLSKHPGLDPRPQAPRQAAARDRLAAAPRRRGGAAQVDHLAGVQVIEDPVAACRRAGARTRAVDAPVHDHRPRERG